MKHLFVWAIGLVALHYAASAQQVAIDLRNISPPAKPQSIGMQGRSPEGVTLTVNNRYFVKDGLPWYPLMGEVHYNRLPAAEWESAILKMKMAGLNTIATYIFWNEHEIAKGKWNWTNNRNLRQFIALCQRHEMFVWLRIGPWCHGEQLHGGFPDWIQQMKGKRTNEPGYIAQVNKLFAQIGQQTKGQYFENGGPVIGVQLENEYASGQAEHISTLKQLAITAGIRPVFWTVTSNTVFDENKMEVIPLQGAYAFRGWEPGGGKATRDFLYGNDQWIMTAALGKVYYDVNRYPKGMCEQGAGSQMTYRNRFVVDPEIIDAHAQNQVGRGMNMLGYYMFHGGTQTPGLKEPGYPESYDFQAPISEFGKLQQSYFNLKSLHHFLGDFGSELAPMQVVEANQAVRNEYDTTNLRYSTRVKDGSGFVFLCNAQNRVKMPDKQVQLAIQLNHETIQLPSFILKGGTSPILPFNLRVQGLNIKYATAQPLARLINSRHTMLFFQELEGVSPTVSIDSAGVASWQVNDHPVQKSLDTSEIVVQAPKTISLIDKNGHKVSLVFLSRAASEQAWRTTINDLQVLLLTSADLVKSGNHLVLQQWKDTVFQVQAYPAENFRELNTRRVVNSCQPNITTRGMRTDELNVVLPQKLPPGVHDLRLDINYSGGSAVAKAGHLVLTDHLFNGLTWQLGTARFNQLKNLVIKALPWDNQITGIDPELAKKMQHSTPAIESLTIVPQYQVEIAIAPPADSLQKVSVADFAALPNDTLNDREAIQQALEYCRLHQVKTLLMPAGVYRIREESAVQLLTDIMAGKMGKNPQDIIFTPYYPYVRGLDFKGIRQLTVEATGAVLMVEGWMEPVSLENCKNITIRGLTIDYATAPHSEGKVTNVTTAYFDVEFATEFPVKDNMIMPRIMFWDLQRNRLLGNSIYHPAKNELIAPATLRIWANHPPDILGTIALINHTFHFRPAILLLEASNTLLEQVTIHAQPGMGIVGHRSHNILMKGLQVVPRPGHYQSTNTDATHFTSCTGTIRFDSCTFEGSGDDATNVHGYYQVITQQIAASTYSIQMEKAWGTHAMVLDYPDAGNILELVSKQTLKVLDSVIVIKADTFQQAWETHVQLNKSLPADLDQYYLINVTRLPRLEFVHSRVRSHLARAILVKTRNVLIEDNVFTESTGTAIHIGAEGDWREGAGSVNVIIRNNRILRCGRGDGTNDNASAIAINLKAPDITMPGIHQHILIEGNTIEGEQSDCGIAIAGADDVVVRKNSIRYCREPWKVKYSTRVRFRDNLFQHP